MMYAERKTESRIFTLHRAENTETRPEYEFWNIDNKGHLVLSPTRLYEFLQHYGGFSINNTGRELKDNLVKVKGNVIYPSTMEDLKRTTAEYIKSIEDKRLRDNLKDALIYGIRYFRADYWYNLPKQDFTFHRDDESCVLFYFSNGSVTVTENGAIHKPNFERIIFKEQILQHEIEIVKNEELLKAFDFNRFLVAITVVKDNPELSKQRYLALMTIIGYLLHTHRKPNDRAIILSDVDQTSCNGGTGKSLLINALGRCRKSVKEDGKLFHIKNRFAYQLVSSHAEVLCFDDAPKDFDFESLFSAITEGINVERKFKEKIRIEKEECPKIVITTNYCILGHGVSFERRKLEFEISNYFNDKRSPLTEYGRRFFDGWDVRDWNLFYSLMFKAVQLYLQNGLLATPEMNLKQNKLVSFTNREFAEYFNARIEPGKEYDKGIEFSNFQRTYPEYSHVKQRTFHNWLETASKILGYNMRNSHSGSKRVFIMELNP